MGSIENRNVKFRLVETVFDRTRGGNAVHLKQGLEMIQNNVRLI